MQDLSWVCDFLNGCFNPRSSMFIDVYFESVHHGDERQTEFALNYTGSNPSLSDFVRLFSFGRTFVTSSFGTSGTSTAL